MTRPNLIASLLVLALAVVTAGQIGTAFMLMRTNDATLAAVGREHARIQAEIDRLRADVTAHGHELRAFRRWYEGAQ